ncbi:MAG: polysaccharide biosynthesis tyrosine autokinase [Verrucomicrobia bacterium]|nr:polysaccharide biosynthesis tyrosine autokinase [Verrucomicrobiota bacterium]
MRKIIEPPSLPKPAVDLAPQPAVPHSSQEAAAYSSAAGVQAKSFDIVDFKQYFHIVIKRIWLVALCFVISLSVTVVNLVKQVPVYRASASVVLSRGLNVPDRLREREFDNAIGDVIDTQMRILQSGLIIGRAREKMNRPASDIAEKLQRISVYPLGKAAVLVISVDALEQQFAADFANAMVDAFLEYKAEERMETSQSTVISLTQQANRLRDELKRAEDRLLQFKKENSVVAIGERGNVAATMLASLSSQSASLRAQRMILQAQQPLLNQASDDVILQALSAPVSLMQVPIATAAGTNNSSPVVLSSGPEGLIERGVIQRPRWEDYRRERAMLESRLAIAREKYKDAHPEVQSLQAQIKNVQRLLDQEVQFAQQQYYAELDAMQVKERAVTRAEAEWESEALEVSRKADDFAALNRDVARLRGLYDLIFNRLKEIDISIGIEPETVRRLERANPPSAPITPRRMQSIFMAALIGLGIGIGLVFGLEFIDDSIRYPEEVTRNLGLEFLGVIPSANWDPQDLRTHLISNIDQKSGLAEAYRNVRSALMTAARDRNHRTLAVTSAVPKEGKTTTSLNLSVSLAQAGLRVLLVDADMRRGELHKFFGLEGGRGLSDVLMGQSKPESVIQRTGINNLDLIATGPFPSNPAELMLRTEFNSFVEYAKRTYDRIIFDAPPMMAVSESAILTSLVDGVVMVVWAGQTSRRLAQMSLQIIRQRGGNLLGCVLSNLEFGRVGYYYYSTYYGYYDYDYRYDRPETPPTKG